MLFASALEQAGLNPIVALPKGHALAGLWLRPDDLASIVIDEAEVLRKQVDLWDLVVIETTYVTSHPAPPLSAALAKGREIIAHEHDENETFVAAVDIRRAPAHSITPLGLQHESVAKGGSLRQRREDPRDPAHDAPIAGPMSEDRRQPPGGDQPPCGVRYTTVFSALSANSPGLRPPRNTRASLTRDGLLRVSTRVPSG